MTICILFYSTKWIRFFGIIFNHLFLILFVNHKKHPGPKKKKLISQINFEKIKFSDIRNQGVIKWNIKNEDAKKQIGVQKQTQKQKEPLNTHMNNIHGIKYSTEDSAPNSSIKFNLNFQWPADCLYLSFKIWICRQIYLFDFLIIWLLNFFNKNTEKKQNRIKARIQQKVQSWIQACIFLIFC